LLGWSHRRTALAEYVLMAASGAAALLGAHSVLAVQLFALGALFCVYLAAGWAVDVRWQRRTPA
jgi:hypothetical protein